MLYIETDTQRFEISCKTNADYDSVYRLVEVADPFYKDEAFFAKQENLPLGQAHIKQIMCEDCPWSDFLWGIDSLRIAQSEIKISPLRSFLFRPVRS